MQQSPRYGGIIWTDHALVRLRERKLPQTTAYLAFKSPDSKKAGKKTGTIELSKKLTKATVTLIVKKNEDNEIVVLTGWIDPPINGTLDSKKKQLWQAYQHAGFWGKLWILFLKQIGVYPK